MNYSSSSESIEEEENIEQVRIQIMCDTFLPLFSFRFVKYNCVL